MSDPLPWTLLRHRVLNAVRDGKVSVSGDGPWLFSRPVSTQAQMARAMNGLWHGDYVHVNTWRGVELTPRGKRLLARWSERREVV